MGITQHPSLSLSLEPSKQIEHSGPLDAIKSQKIFTFRNEEAIFETIKNEKKAISQIGHIFVDALKVHCCLSS